MLTGYKESSKYISDPFSDAYIFFTNNNRVYFNLFFFSHLFFDDASNFINIYIECQRR